MITETMKYIIKTSRCYLTALVAMLVISSTMHAQMELAVNTYPPYPTKFSTWISDQSNFSISTLNISGNDINYFVRIRIHGETRTGEVVSIGINDTYVPSELLLAEANSVNNISPLDLIAMYGSISESDIYKTDNVDLGLNYELPEGEYEICFQLIGEDPTAAPLSTEVCRPFTINQANIELVQPLHQSAHEDITMPVTISWVNFSSEVLNFDYSYTLSIYEMPEDYVDLENVSIEQLLASDLHFQVTDLTDLMYVYDPALGIPELTPGTRYAVIVELVDTDGFSYNNKKSNINVFRYGGETELNIIIPISEDGQTVNYIPSNLFTVVWQFLNVNASDNNWYENSECTVDIVDGNSGIGGTTLGSVTVVGSEAEIPYSICSQLVEGQTYELRVGCNDPYDKYYSDSKSFVFSNGSTAMLDILTPYEGEVVKLTPELESYQAAWNVDIPNPEELQCQLIVKEKDGSNDTETGSDQPTLINLQATGRSLDIPRSELDKLELNQSYEVGLICVDGENAFLDDSWFYLADESEPELDIIRPSGGENVFLADEEDSYQVRWEIPSTLEEKSSILSVIEIFEKKGNEKLTRLNSGEPLLLYTVLDDAKYDIPRADLEQLQEGKDYWIKVYSQYDVFYYDVDWFHYGTADVSDEEEDVQCCSTPSNLSQVPKDNLTGLSSFAMGNFQVENVEVTQVTNNKINGTGEVTIPFLKNVKVKVVIENVVVNQDLKAISGKVRGKEDNAQINQDITSYLQGSVDNQLINRIDNYLDATRMVGNLLSGQAIGMPFVFTTEMEAESSSELHSGAKFGFSKFELSPNESKTEFIFLMSAPELGDGFSMGIGGETCISPQGFGGNTVIKLARDIPVPLDANSDLKFVGSSSNLPIEQTCHVTLSCEGFESVNIVGSVSFSTDLMVKEAPGRVRTAEPVQGRFGVNLRRTENPSSEENETDSGFIFALDMDPFQLKKLEGWSFTVREAAFDVSEISNYGTMQFPDQYDAGDLPSPEFWKGFYLKELAVRAPADFTAEGVAEENGSFTAHNLLIDPRFSARISANNILSYENGTVKGWGISIEGFHLNILQNTFQSAGMSGLLGSPLQSEERGDLLRYTAAISPDDIQDEDAPYVFNAVVRPQDDINLPMFNDAMTVCESSYLGMQLGKDKEDTHMEIFLKGNVGVDIQPNENESGGSLKFALADFQVQYNTSQGFVKAPNGQENGKGTKIGLGISDQDRCSVAYLPDFDQIKESMGDGMNQGFSEELEVNDFDESNTASSEDDTPNDNALNNFQFRLHDFDIKIENGAPHFAFGVDIGLMGDQDGFKAGTSVTIKTKKEILKDGKEKIKFDNLTFDNIRLSASTEAFSLMGCLSYTNRDVDGLGMLKGYDGQLLFRAGGESSEIMLQMSAGFFTYRAEGSNARFATRDYHGIGWVDGSFSMDPGLPLGVMTLHGLGGGVYWNINAPTQFQDPASFNSGGATSATSECMTSLLRGSSMNVPTSVQDFATTPPVYYPPSGGSDGSYRKRTLKFSGGISMANGTLLAMDPQLQGTWTVRGSEEDANDRTTSGLNEIQCNGYMYFLQTAYRNRGAGSAPKTTNGSNDGSIEGGAQTAAGSWKGSKIWMSGFNRLYLDYTEDKVLPFFESKGQLYLNLIPEVLRGAGSNYELINHHVIMGHKDHSLTESFGLPTDRLEGSTYWHAYFGNPYNPEDLANTEVTAPGAIMLDVLGLFKKDGNDSKNNVKNGDEAMKARANVQLTAYVMAGHGIPNKMPPIPDFIVNLAEVSEGTEDSDSGEFDAGDISDQPGREGQLASTTSGFVTGANIFLGLGFEKVIYANLNVMVGMDIMLRNTENMVCSGGATNDGGIGINNYYGTGQAYAGIEGELGVRGKILGKKIDIEFLYFAAKTILEAGGPNPFWMRGEAAISYRILNGLVKGNAQLEFNAGEPCYPIDATPFALDAIHKVYPSEANNQENPASPYDQPMVTFKMPVGMNYSSAVNHPLEVEELIGDDPENMSSRTLYIAPYLKKFEVLKGDGSNKRVMGRTEFSDSHRSVRYVVDGLLAENDQQTQNNKYRMHVEIGARESYDMASWSNMSYEQDTLFDFYVAPLPRYEKYVKFSNPIKGQQFFMEDEWGAGASRKGLIHWASNINDARFYSEMNGKSYEYDVVIKDDSGSEVHRNKIEPYQFKELWTEFNIPSLERNKVYILQLVRRRTDVLTDKVLNGKDLSISVNQISNIEDNPNIYANYTIEVEEDDANSFKSVMTNETLIHHIVFKTSRYHTLEEKISAANVQEIQAAQTTLSTINADVDCVKIGESGEPFDKVELFGRNYSYVINNSLQRFKTQPRVLIYDPLSGPYYEQQLKPEMNALLTSYREEIDLVDIGLRLNTSNVVLPNGQTKSNFVSVKFDRDDLIEGSAFVNKGRYNLRSSTIYGVKAQRLKNILVSMSNVTPLLPDVPMLSGNSESIFNSLNIAPIFDVNTDVVVQDPTKIRVKSDITSLMNKAEGIIDKILNPSNPLSATTSDEERRQAIASTIDAFNSIIGSYYYEGAAQSINSAIITKNPFKGSSTSSFKSSEVEIKYNITPVYENRVRQQKYFGSELIKSVNK